MRVISLQSGFYRTLYSAIVKEGKHVQRAKRTFVCLRK